MSTEAIQYMDEDVPPKLEVEPNRRCFLAMQLPSGSSNELYQNTIIQPPSRRFSAIELNAEELARRLLMIESPRGVSKSFFGDRIKRNSKRRSYECSVFEVVDLGPVSRDKGSTNSLGPAAVHRVSIRRRRPGSDKSEASKSQKSRSSVKSNKSTKAEQELVKVGLPEKSRRKKFLCCCKGEASDEELDTSMQTNATSTVPFCAKTEESPSMLLRAKRRISKLTQFFETIAPREGFADDEALEVYIHDRSRKIEPKDATKLTDVKPKHSPHVLKSPGIKPPKGNHYAKEHPATSTTHLLPATPSPRDHDGSKPSPSKVNHEDFAIIDINPGQLPRYIGDVTRRQAPTTFSFPLGPVPKKAPPPLHPRKTRQPVSNGPPIRSPSVFTPVSASWKPPAPSPPELANKSPRLNQHAQAFIFPEIPIASGSPTPLRPAKAPAPPPPAATQSSTSAEHRVTLPVPSSPNGDSPSVSVSLPPPSLPPRASRPGSIASASSPLPPPRPPKPGHMTASPLTTPRSLAPSTTTPTIAQTQSTTIATKAQPVSTSISSESPTNPDSPPPLPPKTYKSRRQSSSPTS